METTTPNGHGAFTQLKRAVGSIREQASNAHHNLQALYCTGEAPADPVVLAEMASITKDAREIERQTKVLADRMYALTSGYRKAVGDAARKPVTLVSSS